MSPLEGRVALVTGATRGIGAAIAGRLAGDGALVIGTATSAEGAARITQALAAQPHPGAGYAMNVNDTQQVDAVLASVQQRYGDVAILVNNAGITRDSLLMRMKDEEWDDIMSTNLRPVFWLSRRLLRPMVKARYGRIVNITSVVGAIGNPGQTNYAAAKAGIIGFSKSLAREVGARNITVNCVAPGFIDTDMTRVLSTEQRNALIGHIPLGRLGDAGDVAAAVAFLVSDGASYITGSTIHVNGGMHMD
jgi:3-oxoacyl-[acyl-carrier protein] reductase